MQDSHRISSMWTETTSSPPLPGLAETGSLTVVHRTALPRFTSTQYSQPDPLTPVSISSYLFTSPTSFLCTLPHWLAQSHQTPQSPGPPALHLLTCKVSDCLFFEGSSISTTDATYCYQLVPLTRLVFLTTSVIACEPGLSVLYRSFDQKTSEQ